MAPPLEIQVSQTPNPNAARFQLNRVIAPRSATYRDAAAAEAPWARRVLAIPGVTQVFALNDFIAVTKGPDAAWDRIVPDVERILRDVFTSHEGG